MAKTKRRAKHSVRFSGLETQVDKVKVYDLEDALKTVKTLATAKFDESIDLSVKLGVDPRKGDQNVRGTTNLPHGTGKNKVVAVLAKGDLAKEARDAGADIVAVARDSDGLAEVEREVEQRGRRCLVIEAEMGTPEGPVAAARAALEAWGTIDILVNNAAIARIAPATALSLADWDETMAVNVRAPFLLAQALGPAMIAQRWGKVINISSQTGVIALDDHAAYATSKGALNALTKSLCAEWARHNVQVNAICPT